MATLWLGKMAHFASRYILANIFNTDHLLSMIYEIKISCLTIIVVAIESSQWNEQTNDRTPTP